MDRKATTTKMSITIATIEKMDPEQLYTEFLEAVRDMIEMNELESEYVECDKDHSEWLARECWERMSETHKNEVRSYIPNIEDCIFWNEMTGVFKTAFYQLYGMLYD